MDLKKMSLRDLSLRDLYKKLKKLDPQLAKGKSKAKREELEGLVQKCLDLRAMAPTFDSIASAPPLEVPSALSAPVVTEKPKKVRRKKAKRKVTPESVDAVMKLGKKLVERHRHQQSHGFEVSMTEAQKATMLDGLDMISAASMMLQKSGMTMTQIAALIGLDTGVDQEVVRTVLMSLTMLKTTFTVKQAA